MRLQGFTAIPLLVVFVAALIVLAGAAQGEGEFRAEIMKMGLEAEKAGFVRYELENAVDKAVEFSVERSLAGGKFGPGEIKGEVAGEVNKVFGGFGKIYGEGMLDVYITSAEQWAVFVITHGGIAVVTVTFTGGLYRDGSSGSGISVGGSKAVFRIPRGYTRVVVGAV